MLKNWWNGLTPTRRKVLTHAAAFVGGLVFSSLSW